MNDLRTKRRQLQRIFAAARCAQANCISQGMIVAVTLGLFASGLAVQVFHQGGAVPAASGFVVSLLSYFYLPISTSWIELLDTRLTDYEPVDHAAYAELHETTREYGGFNISAVLDWIERERLAISDLTPRKPDGTAEKFMQKPVAPITEDRSHD